MSKPSLFGHCAPVLCAVAVVLSPLGCTCGDDPDVPNANVVSFAPSGTTFEDVAVMEVMFDEPVVAEDQVGHELDAEDVVEIEPEVDVTVRWRDRQTLVIQPVLGLTPGTRYTVNLLDDLPVEIPEDQRSHSFVYHPLEVEALQGVDPAWFPPEGEFALRLNFPVQARAVQEHCRFKASTSVGVRAKNADDVGDTIQAVPASALTKGATYELECEGLIAAGGNEPAEKFTASVTVVPEAAIASVTPAADQVATPDELELVVRTRTPTSVEQIRRALRISPRVPGFADRWMARDETTFYQVVNLDASEDYTLSVAGDLVDDFGQRLGSRYRSGFRTTDAAPRVHLETGIYAVERSFGGYPVWTRNVDRFEVDCAFVPRARIPALLTTTMDYDPWYADQQQSINWSALRLSKRSFAVDVPGARNRWQEHTIDLPARCGGRGPGIYLAEVRSEQVAQARSGDWWRYPYRVLGNITDLGVLLKVGPSSGLVWVAKLSDGQPVPGAAVTVYDTRGRRVHAGRTDDNGLLRMPGSSQLLEQRSPRDRADEEDEGGESGYYDIDDYRAQRMIVVVEKDGDVAAVDGNWANGIQIWNFGVPQDTRTGGRSVMRGFILSDRGIYRPGETVHFKGFVRELVEGSAPRIPSTRRIAVDVEDSTGTEVMSRRLDISEFGGFSFDMPVSSEASLGDYYVRARLGDQTFREEFVVQEFRPVSMEITDRTPADRQHRLGEQVSLTYNAGYLFGAPVANAETRWSVNRRRRFLRFPDYPSYTFEDWSALDSDSFWDRYETSQGWVTDGQTRTDARGNISLRFRDSAREIKGPQDYLVNVSVTDPTDQTVSKQSVVTVHPTDIYLGLHTQEFVQAVNMPFAVQAVAVTPDGQRVAAPAKLLLLRRVRNCRRGEGPYSYSRCDTNDNEVWSRDLSLRAGGVATERINPTEAGEYVIRLEGKDRAGRDVSASSFVWVIGEGEAFWSGDESARMSLIASKEEYQPGDTARLVPQADVGGATALITVERGGIIDARIERLGAGVPSIEIPIQGAHAPNAFVSVAAVRGRRGAGDDNRPFFRMGVANLQVSASQQRLQVEIATEREDYRPGDTVNGSVRVLSGGAPVRAELSLSVADEGVLQLVGYQTPDPMKSFYKPWGLGVENATNWNRIARRQPPAGFVDDEDGDDNGAADDSVRSRFVSSAFWAPALVTDEEGRATFTFEAPDNLTAFRLMAAAADAGERFGSAERRIRVRKELLLKPILPRFFQGNDLVDVGVTVHNYTGTAGQARVTVQPTGLYIRTTEQTVDVPANGSKRVTFRARVSRSRQQVRVAFAAQMGAYQDALRLDVPVRENLIVDHLLVSNGRLEEAGTAETAVDWSDPTLPRDSHLEVTVDRAGMADLEASLRYLVEYPYGCLEQTLSRLIPLFKVRDLATSLRLEPIASNSRLRSYIRIGVDKVLRHQHADGHFSLWPSSNTQPHLTAYAMWGLGEARRAGVRVRQSAIDKGLAALRTWSNDSTRNTGNAQEAATMAMAAFVLADQEQPDAGLNARLYEVRASLPEYGKAYLLRAMAKSGAPSPQLQTLMAELVGRARIDGNRATIQESQPDYWYFSSDTRSTALTLSALIEMDPSHALVPQLVEGLKAARTEGGRWGDTQQNVYGLVGLADFARVQAQGAAQVTVTLGGTRLGRRSLEGNRALHISRPLSGLSPGALRIEADGPVYYSVRLVRAREPTAADAASNGFEIARQYLDFETGAPITSARVGQLIKVQVSVSSSSERGHVAIEDPIPSGCEIVNLALDTEAVHGPNAQARDHQWWRWTHQDLRDDRAVAFAERFSGTQVLEYMMRATRAGTFAVPAARVEEMYSPEVNARTDGMSFTVAR